MDNPHTRRLPRLISFGKEDDRRPDLSKFDGRRIAVVLNRAGCRTVLRGMGNCLQDDILGDSLRIAVENELGNLEFFIAAKDWDGQIIPDFEHGCEFCIVIRLE